MMETIATEADARVAATSTNLAGLRVAISHYWFKGNGGGERVIEALAEIFPQADFFSLVGTEDEAPPTLRGRRVTTSFVEHIPGAKRWYRHFLPLYPLGSGAVRFFCLRSGDKFGVRTR